MDVVRHQRLKELFLRARELPAAEREAFIRESCADDAALQHELRQLLQHDLSQTLLASGSTIPRSGNSSRWKAAVPSPTRGTFQDVPRSYIALAGAIATLLIVLNGGAILHGTIRNSLLQQEAAVLQAQCHATAIGLTNQLDEDLRDVEAWAINAELVDAIAHLDQKNASKDERRLEVACPQLSGMLQRFWGPDVICVVWNLEQVKVLATSNNLRAILSPSTETGAALLNRVIKGESVIYLPNGMEMISEGYRPEVGRHVMSYLAPVRATPGGQVVGAMLVRNDAVEERFHEVFESASFLKSGETYAFSSDARMISRPRFALSLQELGLMSTLPDLPSTTIVSLRDPGGDMTTGYRPTEPRDAQPATELVRRSQAQKSGVLLKGYRDYRGRMVVGAWEWLDRYHFGVALEVDTEEIGEPLRALNYALLIGGTVTVIAAGWVIGNLVRTRRRRFSTLHPQSRVGPYLLEKEIGQGGMGTVFKAQHNLLQRPTALKILKPEMATPAAIVRFTREVQFAARLQHPNTVGIYDYGCTEEGRFYYAMEYLVGVSLHQLVQMFGPVTVPRGMYFLRQLCGSLREAHESGLVHRDIKPQNIMICDCGGEADFVKVVDFGLVKSADIDNREQVTTVGEWVGTPRYMAPERLLQPGLADPRSDIYSVGVMAYWMLTGQDAFDGTGQESLFRAILTEPAAAFPPEVMVPLEFQQIVLKCLQKIPSDRYSTMSELIEALDRVVVTAPWTADAARRWWREHLPELATTTVSSAALTPSATGLVTAITDQ